LNAVGSTTGDQASTGAGVKVGILSDSFNRCGGGLSASIASGDLPRSSGAKHILDGQDGVRTCSEGATDEGRAMAEVIYDLAPGVEFFYYAPITPSQMTEGINLLVEAGCRIIVDDLFFPNDAWYSDGIVASTVQKVANQNRVVYISAAGNLNGATYSAVYTRSTERLVVDYSRFGGSKQYGYSTCHVFPSSPKSSGSSVSLKMDPEDVDTTVYLQWNDPLSVFGGSKRDLDILLADWSLDPPKVINKYGHHIGLREDPIEITSIPEGADIRLSLCLDSGNAAAHDNMDRLRFTVVWESGKNYGMPESPSIFGHPNSEFAIAVAAVSYNASCRSPYDQQEPLCDNGFYPRAEPYSSHGGLPVNYDSRGKFISSPASRRKPDLAGIDCVDTSFYTTGNDFDNDGYPNFCGTSAAAASIAGVVALMVEKCPAQSTSSNMVTALVFNATDLNSVGFDFVTGGGLVNADSAIAAYQLCGSSSTPWITIAAALVGFVIVSVLVLSVVWVYRRRKTKSGTTSTSDGPSFHSLTFVDTNQVLSDGIDDESFPL